MTPPCTCGIGTDGPFHARSCAAVEGAADSNNEGEEEST